MTIEEKAKRYDEAIERARELHDKWIDEDGKDVALMIFPELKESEDEKIRKNLREFLLDAPAQDIVNHHLDLEEALNWLEKQGEQKSIDNLTQQEAMDIAVAKCFEQEERKPILDIEIPFGAKDSELQEASYHIPEGFHTEIEGNKVVIKRGEQKPAWSDEDELMLGKCIDAASGYYSPEDKQSMKDWLRSLKDKVQSQPKQEWSEEDEYMINFISEKLFSLGATPLCSEIKWLKSLKDRYIWKPSDEQIECLSSHIAHREKDESSYSLNVLRDLLEQLKKLREE